MRSYLVGFGSALVLTLVPFAAVGYGGLQRQTTLIIIGVFAVLQTIVHLRYFLHLDPHSTSSETYLIFIFTIILIDLMVGGSVWIMFDLHRRMPV